MELNEITLPKTDVPNPHVQLCRGMFVSTKMVTVWQMGSGRGTVGKAVISATRGPRFDSSHRELRLAIVTKMATAFSRVIKLGIFLVN